MKRLALIALVFVLAGCSTVKGVVYYEAHVTGPSMIAPRLYLLTDYQRADADLLHRLGINAVLGVHTVKDKELPGFTWAWVPIKYEDTPENRAQIERAVDQGLTWLAQGRTVGIGCKAAENRSVVVAAKVLARLYGGTWQDWFAYIEALRVQAYWQGWMENIPQ